MSNTESHRKTLALMLAILLFILTLFVMYVGSDIVFLHNMITEHNAMLAEKGIAAESHAVAKEKLRQILYSATALMVLVTFYGIYLLYYIRKLKFVVYKDVVKECSEYNNRKLRGMQIEST